MIDNQRIMALIPARGGSKGIKDKNIVYIAGKPLIAYTIEAAKASQYIDLVLVSTDSKRIQEVAIQYGAEAPFLRPDELATDEARTVDTVLHALEICNKTESIYEIVVLLQPTSPLRTAADIDGAIEKFRACGERPLTAVSKVSESPLLMRYLDSETHMTKLINTSSTVRRQDMPQFYRVNGSIYINRVLDIDENTSFNDNEIPYILDVDHAVDIDEYKDLETVKYHLKCKRQIP